MIVFYFELPPGEHPGLENDSHRLALDKAVRIIKGFGNTVIYDVIKILGLIHDDNTADFADTLRIYLRAVEAVFGE